MRSMLSAFATVAAAGVAFAQPPNFIGFYPESTDATSRHGLAGSTNGDVLVEFSKDNFAGVGNWTTGGTPALGYVTDFRVYIQDQDSATQENFDYVIIQDDPNNPNNPDLSVTPGVLLRTAPLQPPLGSGIAAWIITATLATPTNVIPKSGGFWYGCGLAANAAWTNDGLSCHMASYYGLAGFPLTHDNPRAGVLSVVMTIDRVNNMLGQRNGSDPRTQRCYIGTDASTLNSGADIIAGSTFGPNPNFGVAGVYPSTSSRNDGTAFQMSDHLNAGGVGVVFGAAAFFPVPIPIGANGSVCLDPSSVFQVTFGTPLAATTGLAVIAPSFLAQGQIPPGVFGTITWQAASVGANGVTLSNGTRTDYR